MTINLTTRTTEGGDANVENTRRVLAKDSCVAALQGTGNAESLVTAPWSAEQSVVVEMLVQVRVCVGGVVVAVD